MGHSGHYTPPGVLIRHMPESRRQRMARLRTGALGLIAVIAASGVVLQQVRPDRPAGVDIASAPGPFDLFPG